MVNECHARECSASFAAFQLVLFYYPVLMPFLFSNLRKKPMSYNSTRNTTRFNVNPKENKNIKQRQYTWSEKPSYIEQRDIKEITQELWARAETASFRR